MTSEPAPNRAHARQRLDEAWWVQMRFTGLSEEPTPKERSALAASLNRVLRLCWPRRAFAQDTERAERSSRATA